MAPRSRSATAAPPTSMFPFACLLAVLAYVLGVVVRLPLSILVLPIIIIGAFMEPPAPRTGPKDKRTGQPTPLEAEVAGVRKAGIIMSLRSALAFPNRLWGPGKGCQRSFIGGLLAAYITLTLPVAIPSWILTHESWSSASMLQWTMFARALAAVWIFVVIHVSSGVVRRADENPGVTMASLPDWLRTNRHLAIIASAVAVIGSLASIIGLWSHPYGFDVTTGIAASILAAGAVIANPWKRAALEEWRQFLEARDLWEIRWGAAGFKANETPPQLAKHITTFEPYATLDEFSVRGKMATTLTAKEFTPVLQAIIGDGLDGVAMFHLLDNGQPSSEMVDVVVWDTANDPVDITDPNLPADLVRLYLRAMTDLTFDTHRGMGAARLVLADITAVHDESSPKAVWALTFTGRPGVADYTIGDRRQYDFHGEFAERVGARSLIDHRANNRHGVLYVGAIGDPETVYADSSMAKAFENMASEDKWRSRWSSVGTTELKNNPPVPQFEQEASAALNNGTVINRLPFITREGIAAEKYLTGIEPDLRSTLAAAPFVSVSGWPIAGNERHGQAFSVFWSVSPVPVSPEKLPPRVDENGTPVMSMTPQMATAAEAWVLQSIISRAFDAAKLKRPDISRVTCLSAPTGRAHLWDMEVRLRGGVTLPKVYSAAETLRSSMNVAWMRISTSPTPGCIRIVAGARPETIQLQRPERDQPKITALDWEHTFRTCNLVARETGELPKLLSSTPVENTDGMLEIEFALPAGITLKRVKDNVDKLRQVSGNAFIDPAATKGKGPGTITMLTSKHDPLPWPAMFDFDAPERMKPDTFPFAVGATGKAICVNPMDQAHVLIVGGQGSGKSATAQGMLYSAVAQGADVVIIDVMKKAVDFEFLRKHAVGFATELDDALALMEAVYAHGVENIKLNQQYKIGHSLKLPEDVRPRRLVVFCDEFTSTMIPDPLPKADQSDPDAMAEREAIQEVNRKKARIGTLAGKIAREHRAAGTSLWLGTQKFDGTVVQQIPGGNDLKDNMARLLLGVTSQGMRQSALRNPFDVPDLGEDPRQGRGMWESLVASRAVVMQSWYAEQGTDDGGYKPGTYAYELDQRHTLDPADMLDLEPFRVKKTTNVGVRGELPKSLREDSTPQEPVEIETVEGFEFSLDDLEALDDTQPEVESESDAPSTVSDLDASASDEPSTVEGDAPSASVDPSGAGDLGLDASKAETDRASVENLDNPLLPLLLDPWSDDASAAEGDAPNAVSDLDASEAEGAPSEASEVDDDPDEVDDYDPWAGLQAAAQDEVESEPTGATQFDAPSDSEATSGADVSEEAERSGESVSEDDDEEVEVDTTIVDPHAVNEPATPTQPSHVYEPPEVPGIGVRNRRTRRTREY